MAKWTLGIAMMALVMAPLAATQAHADTTTKIATVDMQRALQTVNAGKKAKSQLEKEFNARKQQLQKEEANLRKMTEDFKKQSLVMNDKARAKKQSEIQNRIMKYQQETANSQMEIQQKEHQLTQPILDKLRKIVAQVAKKDGYTMVLEKNEDMVLVSPPKDDLTNAVIAAFNKQNS